MKYTRDWTRKVKTNFSAIADQLPRPLRILEIGVWEARSAVWMLENLDPAEYIGIDPWSIDNLKRNFFPRNAEGEARVRAIESLARAMLEPFDNARLIRGASQDVLADPQYADVLFRPGSFGLVYIDGEHEAEAVLADSNNVWPLVCAGGIVVWDDYITKQFKTGSAVQQVADAFLADKPHDVLFRGVQFGVRKR